jgi:hypothetical protein
MELGEKGGGSDTGSVLRNFVETHRDMFKNATEMDFDN